MSINEVELESNEPQEVPRGPNGVVGEATISLTMKRMWHEATHLLVEVGDRHNPRKQEWVPKAGCISLKRFARQQVASGDAVAKAWFAAKAGKNNTKRSDVNIACAAAAGTASRSARRKNAESKKSKPKPDAV